MKVPLLDLKAQYDTIRAEVEPVVREVIESQYFILGPRVKSCEEALAAYCGCPHALGVSSGTDALLLALMTEGIGPGDEVITTPYTFFATAGSIARLGARPVFVDIDPVTFNIDAAHIEAAITPHTKAIMPVHLYGQLADMDAIMALARKHRLVVIEDACQAIGASHQGRRAGNFGEYAAFSFFPSKNLGGFGDGGLLTIHDAARAQKATILRVHGMDPKYYHHLIGGNFRLDALQAAVVEVKLRHLDAWSRARRENAAHYRRLFSQAGLPADAVQLPGERMDGHIYNQFVIRATRRDALLAHLRAADIGTEIYYPVPLHLQTCFQYLGHRPGDFPASERAAVETLALPIYPELTTAQREHVVAHIAAFYK